MPTQLINLNDATPAAPAGKVNIKWQADPVPSDPSIPRNVSAYVVGGGARWYAGTGVPASGLGTDGDFYLNTNGDVYEKVSGAWGSPIENLTGPTGPTGSAGATGATGASGTNGTNGQGVPVGGTTSQALIKNSNADYDTIWATVGGGGGAAMYSDVCSPSGLLVPSIVQSVIIAGISGLVMPGVVAGHLLLVAFACEGTLAPTGVSDNHSGAWTKIVEQTGSTNISMWYSVAGSSASYTITATAGSSSFSHIVGLEILNAQKVVDGTPAGTINASTTQTLSTTTTAVGDILISAIDAFHSAAIFTMPFPWTLIKQMNGSDALAIGYAISHGPGAKTVLWGGNSLDNCANVLAAIKASAGGTDYTAIGNNGDLFINLANGDLYKRIGGVWVYQLSIQTPIL